MSTPTPLAEWEQVLNPPLPADAELQQSLQNLASRLEQAIAVAETYGLGGKDEQQFALQVATYAFGGAWAVFDHFKLWDAPQPPIPATLVVAWLTLKTLHRKVQRHLEPEQSRDRLPVPSKSERSQLRSWTQPRLNEAIWEFKARRSSSYHDLVESIKKGKPGARKAAQEVYGRNAIARALGVKSAAMVSKSPAWREIADELGLSRERKPSALRKRVGFDIAIEQASVEQQDSTASDRDETRRQVVRLIEEVMPEPEAIDMVAKLEQGDMSDGDVAEIVQLYQEQQQDDRRRVVHAKA